ncbi:glycosyltransferase family 4 protein [Paenibacillus hodogayensis]|uniref:Glycosyltransferase family 4 protein n=1 Tax=Paenibacillus hodogayensis TaxID=279208 RepID=A0ABV5VSC3_9BACL
MNIFIDAQPLLGAVSGISNYIRNLYDNLLNYNDNELILFFNRISKNVTLDKLPIKIRDNTQYYNSRYPYKIIRRMTTPNFLYNIPFDFFCEKESTIFHGTNFTHIPSTNKKTVITIHDLAYMIYPETTNEKIYRHHSNWVPYSAQQATKIIAVSSHTKNDIMNLLHVPEEKIEVIYLAAEARFRPIDKDAVHRVLNKYQLPDQYLLFVGTLEPRKNLICLLESFLLLNKNCNFPHKLVIVGAKGWKYNPIFEWVKNNGLEKKVIFTGFVEDEDLPAIYNGADVFLMPSLYEGFGLPILEAMQCGTPVIGSNNSSICEIIDTNGILLPHDDYEQWATNICTLLSNEEQKNGYKKLSLQRATNFSWKKTAHETKTLYEKMLN